MIRQELLKPIKVIKKPTISKVIPVTVSEMMTLRDNYDFISISEADNIEIDIAHIAGMNKTIGYLAGDIEALNSDTYTKDTTKVPDIWFVNTEYFKEHYQIIEE